MNQTKEAALRDIAEEYSAAIGSCVSTERITQILAAEMNDIFAVYEFNVQQIAQAFGIPPHLLQVRKDNKP